jgi:hypothetical protein
MAIARGGITLLAATTSATASKSFTLTQPGIGGSVKLKVTGLATTEKAYLQEKDASGTFIDYEFNGAVPYFDKDGHIIILNEPGEFRVNKEATAGACAVTLVTGQEVVVYD